jgi:hypothetical protein
MTEQKTGTVEEFMDDLKNCGFHETAEPSLESIMAVARAEIDTAMQDILARSKLPLYLFDYLIISVLADIRKADIDSVRINKMSMGESVNGDSE